MESVDNKIYSEIKKCGRGLIFSSSDFTKFGEPKSILKTLERMANSERIIRVSRGV
ncbi:DUF6088 family protein [Bacteroides sp. 214]|uniref:DUF6088 family protein n=1 Tax=Bacteroides sp. 214 TaxID=2302935 RepID=UPI00351B41E6